MQHWTDCCFIFCSNETYGDPREVGINSDSWSELARAACVRHHGRRPLRRPLVAHLQPQVIVYIQHIPRYQGHQGPRSSSSSNRRDVFFTANLILKATQPWLKKTFSAVIMFTPHINTKARLVVWQVVVTSRPCRWPSRQPRRAWTVLLPKLFIRLYFWTLFEWFLCTLWLLHASTLSQTITNMFMAFPTFSECNL